MFTCYAPKCAMRTRWQKNDVISKHYKVIYLFPFRKIKKTYFANMNFIATILVVAVILIARKFI